MAAAAHFGGHLALGDRRLLGAQHRADLGLRAADRDAAAEIGQGEELDVVAPIGEADQGEEVGPLAREIELSNTFGETL